MFHFFSDSQRGRFCSAYFVANSTAVLKQLWNVLNPKGGATDKRHRDLQSWILK